MAPQTTRGAKGEKGDKGKAKAKATSRSAAGARKAGGRKKAGPAPRSAGLEPDEVWSQGKAPPATGDGQALDAVTQSVSAAGGQLLCRYRDPLGGHWLVLAALPIDQIDATPFQRELSDAHTRRLVGVIPKVGRFLDPVIAVRAMPGTAGDGAGPAFWTPNGMHRLEAMRRLGARSIVALVVPETELAYRILALNTEKAHNLKDKSLEVVRMEDALAAQPDTADRPESDWAFEFEEPAYLTIGRAYQERARFSGGAYQPVVKRCESFFDRPLTEVVPLRRARAVRLLALDDLVNAKVAELKAAGLKSTYLKPFVVARLNPLRFVPAPRSAAARAAPGPDFDETLDKMMARGEKLDASKVRPQDLAAMGGAPPEADD